MSNFKNPIKTAHVVPMPLFCKYCSFLCKDTAVGENRVWGFSSGASQWDKWGSVPTRWRRKVGLCVASSGSQAEPLHLLWPLAPGWMEGVPSSPLQVLEGLRSGCNTGVCAGGGGRGGCKLVPPPGILQPTLAPRRQRGVLATLWTEDPARRSAGNPVMPGKKWGWG